MVASVTADPYLEEEEDPFNDTAPLDQIWRPANDMDLEPILRLQSRKAKLPEIPSVTPSEFTQFAFHMPAHDGFGSTGTGYDRFSFEGRRHMKRLYDTPAKRILLKCARQVEKSTYLGNRALCYMSVVPSFLVLYVSPSATQTKVFSNDRVKDPIETSPLLKRFTTRMLSSNILEKQFINRSKITMRYAFLNADRARGIPAWMLEIDEFQDVLGDNLPVIEQCLSHAPENWKQYIYAGTPKSLDNNIEYYWSNFSSQNEWVVPHDCKGGEGGRFWNVLGEKNIGKKGLICSRCHTLIDPMCADAQWASMVKDADFEGYRIPQLMVPWKPWSEILLDYRRYPRDKFYNEVLGLSYDSGLRPLTRAQVQAVCKNHIRMHPDAIEKYRNISYSQPVFAGIDWGTGENAYTVISLGTYVDMKFRIFFIHRFEGEDVEPTRQLERIAELVNFFNCRLVGCDYGGGYDRNDAMTRKFGPQRIQKFQYLPRSTRGKVMWNGKLGRWQILRTELMSDVFNAIKRGRVLEFPRWEEFKTPYADDMLNIFSEYNETLRTTQYKHAINKPDDSFHSILYCWITSMLVIPRPDVMTPVREEDGQPVFPNFGPTYQG